MAGPPLLLGYAADSTTTHLRAVAAVETADVGFIDLAELHRRGEITETASGTVLAVGRQRQRLRPETAVFQRLVAPEPRHTDSSHSYVRELMAHSALTAVLAGHPGLVVNGIGAGWHNSAKLFHLLLLAAQGFAVPRSLCSADPEAVADFLASTGRAVYKSNSGRRSIVAELTLQTLHDRGPLLVRTPVLFQELVEGDDVRVHIVGEDAYAVRAVSGAVDYRYARRSGHDVELRPWPACPDDVLEKCRAFCAAHGLHLAGFDFKLSAAGWVCLEANPSPAFESYDHVLDGVIARAVLRLLRRAPGPPEH